MYENYYDCNNCSSSNTLIDDYANGQLVCTFCGVVQEMNMFGHEPSFADLERCDFDYFEDNTHENTHKDQSLEACKEPKQSPIHFSQKKHTHLYNEFFSNISTNAVNIHDNVVKHAADIFVQFSLKKITRGSVRKGIIACSLIKACCNCNFTVSIKEIAKITNVDSNVITKAKKLFNTTQSSSMSYPFEDNSEYNSFYRINNKFCNLLDFPPYIRQWIKAETLRLFNKIDSNRQTSPLVMSASLICYVLKKENIKFDKQHISTVLDVSIVTLNKKLKDFSMYNL